LHLATHGVFTGNKIGKSSAEKRTNPIQNPYLNSMLFWAGAQYTLDSMTTVPDAEDGILTALEALNLQLDQTEIVVLSACETGLGNISNGEGVYGLQRALQAAGAHAVLMSLWKVEDEVTRELMVLFYQQWLDGTPRRDALRMAQQKIKEKYELPIYWGAFVLIGE
ncbi:MAG: CHAT domain-containing protein, partial [Saprospiraceae bacterium]|nr:CHAT domain-containing protein [Saprospiraceae bacterium]